MLPDRGERPPPACRRSGGSRGSRLRRRHHGLLLLFRQTRHLASRFAVRGEARCRSWPKPAPRSPQARSTAPATVYGDLSASGTYPDGEIVTVYTCATGADVTREQSALASDDAHGEVTIPAKLTVIQVTAADDLTTGGYAWDVIPQQIAQDVRGLVITPAT